MQRFLRPSLIATTSRVLTTRTFSSARTLFNKDTDATTTPPPPPADDEKKGFLKSVLYGKKEEQPFFGSNDPTNATTHSKKLARGKYVHEMQSKYLGGRVKERGTR